MNRDHNHHRWDETVGHLIHRADQTVGRLFHEDRKDASAPTWRQYIILSALNDASRPNQTDLVRTTGIDRSTLSDIVRRMESRGLIKRLINRPKDRRAVFLSLTPKGRRLLRKLDEKAQATEDALRALVPQRILKNLTRGLMQIALTPIHEGDDASMDNGVARTRRTS